MMKYMMAAAVGTGAVLVLSEPVGNFLFKPDAAGGFVTKTLGEKTTLALATGGLGAVLAVAIAR